MSPGSFSGQSDTPIDAPPYSRSSDPRTWVPTTGLVARAQFQNQESEGSVAFCPAAEGPRADALEAPTVALRKDIVTWLPSILGPRAGSQAPLGLCIFICKARWCQLPTHDSPLARADRQYCGLDSFHTTLSWDLPGVMEHSGAAKRHGERFGGQENPPFVCITV